MGIEPTYSAWKAAALPLSYTRDLPPLLSKFPAKGNGDFANPTGYIS